jgi:hypothetical protein
MSAKDFFYEILQDNKENVDKMLNKDEDLIKTKNEDKLSPLAFAVVEGADKTIKVLIDHRANPNEEVKEGPLKGQHIVELAAERNDDAVAKALVRAAPGLQITTEALRVADKHGHKDTLATMCQVLPSNAPGERGAMCKHATRRVASQAKVNHLEITRAPQHTAGLGIAMGQTNHRTGFARNMPGMYVEGARGGRRPRRKTRAKRSKKTRKSKSRKSRR